MLTFKFLVKEKNHFVAVDSVTSSSVRINVTSELQQAALTIGETKKFDVTNDNYYDLSVTLNSINNGTNADITIKAISEEVPVSDGKKTDDSPQFSPEDEEKDTTSVSEEESSSFWIWIIIGVVLLLGIGCYWFVMRNRKE